MKRITLSLLLILCLLAGLATPIFAEESETEPAATEEAITLPEDPLTESSEPLELPAGEIAEPEEASEDGPETRAPDTLKTSDEGISFIADFTGRNPKGTQQLAAAESAVNAFNKRDELNLTQTQFDALVDFVMEKGTNMFTQGYQCEKVISKGGYTDAELASAFCAWVKDGIGNFSETNLSHRLRQIKLFLYGSYSGICDANFRYVVYDANGGKLNDNTVLCYTYESTFTDLPTATRSGMYFAGWFTSPSGGTHLCNGYSVSGNYRVYAHWSETAVSDPNAQGSGESQTDPGTTDTTPNSDSGAGVTTYPNHPYWPALPALKISEAGIQFIKNHEGFAQYPIWDYGQYSVGYGSCYDPSNSPIKISSPITLDEADYLLRYYLSGFEKAIDKVLEKGTVTHTQAQYDAIVSLTYNLGQQWVDENYNIYKYILFGGCTETDFVNTMGSWCSAGGTILSGLCKRRMEEADLYFNGDYTLNNTQYRCLIFNGAGGSVSDNVEYYRAGTALGWLPSATKYGNTLVGWFDKTNGGTQFTTDSLPPSAHVTYLYAHWTVGEPPAPPVVDPQPDYSDFSDVHSSDWFYPWVNKAVEAKLFGGISEKLFAPDSPMTRAMLVTVLYRMAGSPAVSGTSKFTDVPADEWYSDAVLWAADKGIVNGVSETEFAPESNISREQLAVILYRDSGSPAVTGSLAAFPDSVAADEYAVNALIWAVEKGIISGSEGLLLPQSSATRAQCAKILVSYQELSKS